MKNTTQIWHQCRELLAQDQIGEALSLLHRELSDSGHPAIGEVARLREAWTDLRPAWRADDHPAHPPARAVARLKEEIYAFLAWLEEEDAPPETTAPEPMQSRDGGAVDWFGEVDGEESARGGDIFGEMPTASAPPDTAPAAFEAYPHISDPGPVAREAGFEISVGFREELDESLEGVQKIFIERPKEIDFVDVLVVAVGARIDQTGMQKLFLNLNSQIRVSGTVLAQSEEVLLTVLYFYGGQPVGQGTRRIAVRGFERVVTEPRPTAEPLAIGREMDPVDLVVTATYSAANELLSWRIVAGGEEVGTPTEVAFAEGRQFAGQMMSSLLAESFAGRAAWNILQGFGARVAQLYPAGFFTALRKLNDTLDRPPRVLLLTNEFYVPWELAYHAELALDPAHPPFLNMQAAIGRWLLSPGITRQPVDMLPFDQFCVVAADYPFDSDHIPLEQALEEKKMLIEVHQAKAIEAKKEDLLGLASQPPAVGRILHLALHGYSRPDLNEQSIALEDGSLSAEGWLPIPIGDQKPVLSFVFLNACQVGTAGSHLSQAGGFPGALFLRGLLGFVAPLWDVHDAKARTFSEGFYEQILDQRASVGETILQLRRRVDYRESVTEMAYVYYGHPGLKLELAAPRND